MYLMNLGDRLTAIRKKRGLTQLELAKKAGLSQPAIFKIEKGVSRGTVYIVSIAKALNVSPEYLLFGNDENKLDDEKNYFSVRTEIPLITWEKILENNYKRFLLKIENDSMTSPLAAQTTFRKGDIITVYRALQWKRGDFVIAKLPNNTIIFRQYVIEGGQQFLRPLNHQYPMIVLDSKIQIVGVVIEVKSNLVEAI